MKYNHYIHVLKEFYNILKNIFDVLLVFFYYYHYNNYKALYNVGSDLSKLQIIFDANFGKLTK